MNGKESNEPRLGMVEKKFADLIWTHEPISSGELVKLCAHELEWKKSTTYTVLKKLCERGIFVNNKGMVTSILSKDEFSSQKSEYVVDDSFQGSLPAFIAAFTKHRRLSKEEIDEIRTMIDKM